MEMTDDLDDIRSRFADGREPVLHCDAGWYPLVVRLHHDLMALFPDLRYIQIKQKDGGLRVYTSHDRDPEALALTSAAEVESLRTCELCGSPGKPMLTKQSGWCYTRCPAHAEGYVDVP